jgi:hypothetical protein
MKKKVNKGKKKDSEGEFIYELLYLSEHSPGLNKKMLVNLMHCLFDERLPKIKKIEEKIIEIEE